ncbi:DUF6924 domain-containing protein [Dactylosporangium darangshiense]|uniref:DUF6924 domain-containing protein n=1 Tax=Dactylosporangium darangshiense TaxID=579108 RepID=A0ABP8DL20_9ACTN
MLPEVSEEHGLLVRTDFSDDAAWDELCVHLQQILDTIHAILMPIDNPDLVGLTPAGLAGRMTQSDVSHAFLADHVTFSDPGRSLVAVDLYDDPGRVVRVTPAGFLHVQAGLTAGNVLFWEIAEHWTAEQGICR